MPAAKSAFCDDNVIHCYSHKSFARIWNSVCLNMLRVNSVWYQLRLDTVCRTQGPIASHYHTVDPRNIWRCGVRRWAYRADILMGFYRRLCLVVGSWRYRKPCGPLVTTRPAAGPAVRLSPSPPHCPPPDVTRLSCSAALPYCDVTGTGCIHSVYPSALSMWNFYWNATQLSVIYNSRARLRTVSGRQLWCHARSVGRHGCGKWLEPVRPTVITKSPDAMLSKLFDLEKSSFQMLQWLPRPIKVISPSPWQFAYNKSDTISSFPDERHVMSHASLPTQSPQLHQLKLYSPTGRRAGGAVIMSQDQPATEGDAMSESVAQCYQPARCSTLHGQVPQSVSSSPGRTGRTAIAPTAVKELSAHCVMRLIPCGPLAGRH